MRLPANTELSCVGLSAAQRTTPLTVIVAEAGYPESFLSPEQFELFREATLHALDKKSASKWPRFETSICFITSFVLKMVERLVDRYIRDKVLMTKPLHRYTACYQHAYKAGHSTETALSKTVNVIDDQLNLKGFAVGTFMDIKGPFNHPFLQLKLFKKA